MFGSAANPGVITRGRLSNWVQLPNSNRRALRSTGSLAAIFYVNLHAPAHELEFLIDTLTIRNRPNRHKTNTGGHF